MQRIPDGRPFHGEFSNADASALNEANSRFSLYGAGSTSTITLASNDQVLITDLSIIAGAALTVTPSVRRDGITSQPSKDAIRRTDTRKVRMRIIRAFLLKLALLRCL